MIANLRNHIIQTKLSYLVQNKILIKTISLHSMVPKYFIFFAAQFVPVGSGPTSYQIILIFRPRLAEGPNIQLQKTFFDYLASVRISERAKLSDFDRIEIQKNDLLW